MSGPRRFWLGPEFTSCIVVADEVLGKYIYTLLELSSYVTVHRLSPTPEAPSELIARLSMLPKHDEPVRPKLGASEILLLPPVRPDGPSLLIASNRDSPSAEGDALALYAVSPDGGDVQPTKEAFVRGVGRHLRGVAADPSGRWVMVCGRDEGGVKLFERVGEDGLELKEVAKIDIPNTVCPLWMS
jgi:6-phosphogluconolactonase